MASILLIEDGPGIGGQLPGLLAAAGHRVLLCGGGPTPLAACPLLRQGHCPLADAAELLVFACPLDLPLRGRSYRGIHLLHAYRAHPDYGRLPLVLVAVAPPQDLEGPGPTETVATFTDPAAVLAAVHRRLQPRPAAADHQGTHQHTARWTGPSPTAPAMPSSPSSSPWPSTATAASPNSRSDVHPPRDWTLATQAPGSVSRAESVEVDGPRADP